jgi:enoyl-CoA hydratase/carnithine racemase
LNQKQGEPPVAENLVQHDPNASARPSTAPPSTAARPSAQASVQITDPGPLVQREQRGNLAVLTMMYRPYNLLGPKLMNALVTEIEQARDAGSRAIVLRSGLRHFSAGADLGVFEARVEQSSGDTAGEGRKLTGVEFLRFMELLPIPIVASVHGVCLGGGLELALACDYIVAATSAKIGSVEATLGLHPLLGGIQRQVQRIGAARAKEMSMLARRYDAPTLEKWGLINLTVPEEQLESATLSIAQEFAQGPTLAHAATKELVHIAVNEGVDAADRAMARVQAPIWASEDLKLGLASFRKSGPGLAKFVGR